MSNATKLKCGQTTTVADVIVTKLIGPFYPCFYGSSFGQQYILVRTLASYCLRSTFCGHGEKSQNDQRKRLSPDFEFLEFKLKRMRMC